MNGDINGHEWNGAEYIGFSVISNVTDRISDLYTQRSITDRISRIVTLGQIYGETEWSSSTSVTLVVFPGVTIFAHRFECDAVGLLAGSGASIAAVPVSVVSAGALACAGESIAIADFSASAAASITMEGVAV